MRSDFYRPAVYNLMHSFFSPSLVKYVAKFVLPLALATYLLGAWNVFLLVPAVPLLCLSFLCAAREGRAEQFLIIFLLANLAISFLSPNVVERDNLLALLGVDFAILFGLLLFLAFTCRVQSELASLQLRKSLLVFLGLLGIYFSYGWLAGNGLAAVAAYLRLYLFPFLFFLLGLVVRPNQSVYAITAIFFVFLGLLVFEYVAPQNFYQLTNMADYYTLKMSQDFTPASLAERNVRDLFNFELLDHIKAYRPLGALGHAISSSYLFLFFTLWFLSRRQYALALVGLMACLAFGVKGSVLALGLIATFEVFYRARLRLRWQLSAMFLIVLGYLVLALIAGVHIGNAHMVKLVGAFYHIPENFLGGGLGFGGSMSRSMVEGPQFDDSVLAVGLSQLGLLGIIVVYTFYLALVRRVALPHLHNGMVRLAFFYCIALLANSVFQEEGFSPYALGLALFMLAYAVSTGSPSMMAAGAAGGQRRVA